MRDFDSERIHFNALYVEDREYKNEEECDEELEECDEELEEDDYDNPYDDDHNFGV
jgi:hypothetical protein